MKRLLILMLACLGMTASYAAQPPNVIVILADDMAIGDLACFNGGITRTPNLDRLIGGGLWMQRAYSGSCVCAPSRAALLTGRYPHRTGVVTLDMNKFPELTRLHRDETTLAQVFASNGYRTGLVGKWHTGIGDGDGPVHRGFQEFEGFQGSDQTAYFDYAIQTDDKLAKAKQPTDKYLTDELSDRAVGFVRRHAKEPFFLHLAHYAPHRPLEAPEEFIKPYVKAGFDQETATVYAMVEIMDKGIGRLMQELDSLGIRERTLVIFASDNGPDSEVPKRFNLEMRGTKYQTYEGGIHVPMTLNWPGTIKPGTSNVMVHFTDVFPTLMELCSLKHEPVRKLDGVSFAPLLTGKGSFEPPPRFWQWSRGAPNYTHNAAMRDGPWKLMRPFVSKKESPKDSKEAPVLYNLETDPAETNDVSGQQPERFEKMKTSLEAWCREVEQDRVRKPD